jgi:hypothetical protein
VTTLLKKSKEEMGVPTEKRNRMRKNKQQLKILENEYEKDPNWTRERVIHLSATLGLRECQVYKWHWDQTKKNSNHEETPQSSQTVQSI